MGNSAATQAMATPSPYEFVSNMIPGPQVEPFWTQVRERCQQLGIHDPGPYGPCTEEDWQEVSKICQIHKNSYPPGKWENIQYMKDCYHAWDKCLHKYKKKEEMLKEAQDRIIALPPTTTRSHTKETPIPKTEESGPISKKGTLSIEEETEKEVVGASFKAPLMTIGDTEVHIPLPLGTLSKIKELCPNPKKYPRDAGTFLAKYSAGTGLDKDDIKGILSIVDPDSPEEAPVDDLWATHIQINKDWISFWKGMGGHWSKLYKGSSALQELILAKQGPKEKFYDYCTRVYSLWKAVDRATPQLFTTTIMSGGDPKVTQLLKFTNPKWAEQAPDEFMKDARSRETSGVFEQKGGIFPSLTQTQTLVTPETSSSPPHLMTMQPYPPDQGCFNCGEQGHWKSQCPYRQRVSYPRGRGRGYNAANRPPPPSHYKQRTRFHPFLQFIAAVVEPSCARSQMGDAMPQLKPRWWMAKWPDSRGKKRDQEAATTTADRNQQAEIPERDVIRLGNTDPERGLKHRMVKSKLRSVEEENGHCLDNVFRGVALLQVTASFHQASPRLTASTRKIGL
ncbi:uncharacterized protein LOC143929823 [Lithobates pipiens]